jgi:homoserine dehydrogenase
MTQGRILMKVAIVGCGYVGTRVAKNLREKSDYTVTKNFLMVQAPGFIRGINLKLRSIVRCARQPQKSSSPRIYLAQVNLKSQIAKHCE